MPIEPGAAYPYVLPDPNPTPPNPIQSDSNEAAAIQPDHNLIERNPIYSTAMPIEPDLACPYVILLNAETGTNT